MSDYNDVLYDPLVHTHSSCIDEVAACDVVVLIVGARYGGTIVPEALSKVDFERLHKESKSVETLKNRENLSVTQLEILKAVEAGVPVFTFIDIGVWHDHATYEKNKDKDILSKIEFPSIQKPETASFIFEFINFLRHRARGNSVFAFSKLQDIEETLRKQWSGLFQKLLQEQRNRIDGAKRIDNLSEQFEDLKTAILASIGTTNERDVARAVVRFRRLIELVRGLGLKDINFLTRGKPTWEQMLEHVGIKHVVDTTSLPKEIFANQRYVGHLRPRMFLIKSDDTFYELRSSPDFLHTMSVEWGAFVELSEDTRNIVVDALGDMRPGLGPVRYIREPFHTILERWMTEERSSSSEVGIEAEESSR